MLDKLRFRINILLVASSLAFQSCSLLDSGFYKGLWESSPSEEEAIPTESEKQEQPDSKTTKVGIQDLKENKARTLSDVEVIWQIPEQPVDGYVLRYGYTREKMDQEVKLKTSQLEKFEDRQHGFVFRHVLSGVPLSRTIYVSIAAFDGDVVSKPSQTLEVRSQGIK